MEQPPPPPYDSSQEQKVVTVSPSPSPSPVPQQQVYPPSPVPGQQVYYVPYPVAGQQMVNVSPCPSPGPQQQVYAQGPQQQVYAPGPQQQVINVDPQPSSGATMEVGGFGSRAISTTCPACKNQVVIDKFVSTNCPGLCLGHSLCPSLPKFNFLFLMQTLHCLCLVKYTKPYEYVIGGDTPCFLL